MTKYDNPQDVRLLRYVQMRSKANTELYQLKVYPIFVYKQRQKQLFEICSAIKSLDAFQTAIRLIIEDGDAVGVTI